MSDHENLTLGDIERIAARLEAACRTFQEAKALLGGGVPVGPGAQAAPIASGPNRTLTAYEIAQRESLLARNREALPDDVKRLEGLT